MKTYKLNELVKLNIDSWVEAMSTMADNFGYLIDGYKDDECPAEYESEFYNLAIALKMRFYENGKLASFQRVPATAFKPCPCCGGVASIETDWNFTWIVCDKCGIRTNHYDIDWDDDALSQAAKVWNNRK